MNKVYDVFTGEEVILESGGDEVMVDLGNGQAIPLDEFILMEFTL